MVGQLVGGSDIPDDKMGLMTCHCAGYVIVGADILVGLEEVRIYKP